MSRIESRLEELGLTLPEALVLPGNFQLVKVHDGLRSVRRHAPLSSRRGAVGFFHCPPGFGENPRVLNGFSDLIVELWGEAGRHARSAPGQGPSPLNVPVIVDAIVAVA